MRLVRRFARHVGGRVERDERPALLLAEGGDILDDVVAGRKQHMSAIRTGDLASIRRRTDAERGTEIGQRQCHGTRTRQQDLLHGLPARVLVAHIEDVRIQLQTPHAITGLVEEIGTIAACPRDGGGSHAPDARQLLGRRRRIDWIGRVEIVGLRRHLREIAFGVHPERGKDDLVLRVRIGAVPRKPTEGLRGDAEGQRLRRRVDETQVMRHPAGVDIRDAQGIVLELVRDLDALVAEELRHRGVHVGTRGVGAVELVDHLRLAGDVLVRMQGGRLDVGELRSPEGVPRHESRGVVAARHAVDPRLPRGGIAPLPRIVEDRLLRAARAKTVRQRVDVGRHLGIGMAFGIERLVDEFEAENRGIVRIALPGEGIDVFTELLQEARLDGPALPVGGHLLHRPVVGESFLVLGIGASPPGNGREDGVDAIAGAEVDQLVEQFDVVVRDKGPLVRRELAVEAVDAKRGETKAAEMRHVFPHHPIEVETLLLDCLVVHRERRIVVDAEEGHFRVVVRPAHHAFGVHLRQSPRTRYGSRHEGRYKTKQGKQEKRLTIHARSIAKTHGSRKAPMGFHGQKSAA